MPRRALERIQAAIRLGLYDVTAHAVEEMADDELGLADVEATLLGGTMAAVAKDDLRGSRYTVCGHGTDGRTPVAVVGRFTATGRYLIITVYELTEQE